jgi:hypothetical protein
VKFAPMNKIARWILLAIGRFRWGLPVVIFPDMVEMLGPLRALRWMASNLPRYERELKMMGGVRGNLVYMVASLLNGCAYCANGHGRAFELHYFDQFGRLFPLDEHEIISLMSLTDTSMRKHLETALADAGLVAEIAVVQRLWALKFEEAQPTADEGHLAHAIEMFDVLNRCAIGSQAALDDAHDPINKDRSLKARYAEARLREGGPRPALDEIEDAS